MSQSPIAEPPPSTAKQVSFRLDPGQNYAWTEDQKRPTWVQTREGLLSFVYFSPLFDDVASVLLLGLVLAEPLLSAMDREGRAHEMAKYRNQIEDLEAMHAARQKNRAEDYKSRLDPRVEDVTFNRLRSPEFLNAAKDSTNYANAVAEVLNFTARIAEQTAEGRPMTAASAEFSFATASVRDQIAQNTSGLFWQIDHPAIGREAMEHMATVAEYLLKPNSIVLTDGKIHLNTTAVIAVASIRRIVADELGGPVAPLHKDLPLSDAGRTALEAADAAAAPLQPTEIRAQAHRDLEAEGPEIPTTGFPDLGRGIAS